MQANDGGPLLELRRKTDRELIFLVRREMDHGREAIRNAVPKPRKKTERRHWKMAAAVDFVNAILEADRRAPRKQRHTAHRIWERIRQELPDCQIGDRNGAEVCARPQSSVGNHRTRDLCAAKIDFAQYKFLYC